MECDRAHSYHVIVTGRIIVVDSDCSDSVRFFCPNCHYAAFRRPAWLVLVGECGCGTTTVSWYCCGPSQAACSDPSFTILGFRLFCSLFSLDVFRAAELSDRQAMDDRLELSTFGQIFQALRDKPPSFFRVSTYGRGWVVVSKGLHATDGGGPYRECLERMCQVGAMVLRPIVVQ